MLPTVAVLMEVAAQLLHTGIRVNLDWVPRDHDSEADAPTNHGFTAFAPENRVRMNFSQAALHDWHKLGPMLEAGQKLYADLDEARERRPGAPRPGAEKAEVELLPR